MRNKKYFLKKYKRVNKFLQKKSNIFNHKKVLRKKYYKISLIVVAVLIVLSMALFSFDVFSQEQNTMVLDMSLSADNYNSATKTFTDRSGNNNHGVSNNNAVFETGRYGSVDGAMNFDGSSDYINISNDGSLGGMASISFGAWVNPNSLGLYQVIVGGIDYEIVLDGDGASCPGNIWWAVRGSDWGLNCEDVNININEWTHLILVSDKINDEVRIYKNGDLVVTNSGTTDIAVNGDLIGIGRRGDGWGNVVDGKIDDVHIYNYALSSEEVKSLYDSEKVNYSASSLQKGLIGHWTMDEVDYNSSTNRLTDKTPYSNHGIGNGLSVTSDRNDKVGSATNFNGGNSSVVFNNTNSDYNFTAGDSFSYGAWFYATSFPNNWHGIISKMPIWGEGYNLQVGPSNNIACGIGVYVSTSWTPELNKWYHSMCVYDGSKMTLYVDGIEENSLVYSINPGNTDLKLGMFYTYGALPFYGKIDDVRIYNRALSGTEIKSLYDLYEPKISGGSLNKGLVGHWTMDEVDYNSNTNRLTDKTSYSNHGTNNGATFITNINGKEGGAMSFDGINDYVNVGKIKEVGETTVVMWFKTNDTGQHNELIHFNSGSDNAHFDFNHSGNSKPLLYLNGSHYRYFDDLAVNYLDGEWHQFVLYIAGSESYSIDDATLHIDTVKIPGSNTSSSEAPNPWGSFHIGRGKYDFFDGQIDNVRIYNRSLSDSEIQSLYDQGASATNITIHPE